MIDSQDPNIRYSIDEKVFVIQIHRPEKKNALLPAMYRALGDGLKQADANESINVVLIKGVEDCFTSGNDVSGFVSDAETTDSSDSNERPSAYFMRALADTRKPIVAAVSGLAIGIGTTMLFHCDLIYASEESYLQMPFTRLGVSPEAGSSYLLPRQVGYQRAAELILLGDRFSAEKAQEYGIVTELLPQNKFLDYALEKSHELATLPSQAVQESKRLLKKGTNEALHGTIDSELEVFGKLVESPEAQAIVKAFLDRKKTG
jgi:enoyl-CoA hydratase/carnithine racemase